MAYVVNTGEGEWALFLYDGSAWIQISDEDSASTDASSISYTFTAGQIGGIGTSRTVTVGRLSPGSRIVSVLVDVGTAYAGQSNPPELSVGTTTDIDQFQDEDQNDLTDVGQYTTTPGYVYPSTETTELEIKAKITHNNATSGVVTVTITYV